MIQLLATCGCKFRAGTPQATPEEVLALALRHAQETGHRIALTGAVALNVQDLRGAHASARDRSVLTQKIIHSTLIEQNKASKS